MMGWNYFGSQILKGGPCESWMVEVMILGNSFATLGEVIRPNAGLARWFPHTKRGPNIQV